MDKQQINQFDIIGITVRTTNENGQSGIDIPKLWNKFMSEAIIEKIPNKADNTLYCIYTEYEKDHTTPYTTMLGCKVTSLDTIPNGMSGKSVVAGNYIKYTVKGNLLTGIVFDLWKKIWNSNIPRTFTTDFEVYGKKAQNQENAEVDVFIGV